jgi:hypothetical protein
MMDGESSPHSESWFEELIELSTILLCSTSKEAMQARNLLLVAEQDGSFREHVKRVRIVCPRAEHCAGGRLRLIIL